MSDLQGFIQTAIQNILPLVGIVMAITTVAGKFGAKGKGQLAVSLVSGFVLGVWFQWAIAGAPVTPADYLMLFLYGFLPGGVASGVYEMGLGMLKKTTPTLQTFNTIWAGADDDVEDSEVQ